MQAGTHGEALLRVADRLREEFADPGVAELPGAHSTLGVKGEMTGMLGPEDESLVVKVRGALAAIAATLFTEAEEPSSRAVETTLDGAEFVIRGELLTGNPERVLRLMPSFVFLVALSVVDQDRALELSRRTSELVAEARQGRGLGDGRSG